MNELRISKLREIAAANSRNLVSIFAPMQPAGNEVRQNRIRWKMILKQCLNKLIERGVSESAARTFLSPAQQRLDDISFWQNQSSGLVHYISRHHCLTFQVPIHIKQIVVVGDRFHVTPMLKLEIRNKEFLLLAFTRTGLQLHGNVNGAMQELKPASLPLALREAISKIPSSKNNSPNRQPPRARPKSSRPTDSFIELDQALSDYLGDERVPILFAGEQDLFSAYQAVARYPYLVNQPLDLSGEMLSHQRLMEMAQPLAQSAVEQSLDQVLERYQELKNTQYASDSLNEILKAAETDEVEEVLVAEEFACFGRRSSSGDYEIEGPVPKSKNSIDLINAVAVETLSRRGRFTVVDQNRFSGTSKIVAILRSPMSQCLARPIRCSKSG